MKNTFFSKKTNNSLLKDNLPALILALVLILLAVGSCLYLLLGSMEKDASPRVRISQNGQVIREISLGEVTEPFEFTVTGENGSYNTIRISPEGVAVTEASCPDKICVRTGIRKDSLLPIICLPNRLVIEILEEDGLSWADTVTY